MVAAAAVATGARLIDVDEGLLARANAADAASGGDGGADADAQVSQPYTGIPCGDGGRCQPPGQVCCAQKFGDPDIANGACSTSDLCQTGDWFACASPRDCVAAGVGRLCCAVHDKGAFNVTKCAASCDATSSVLCDPQGAPCAGTRRCLPSPEFPKLFECVMAP